MLDCRFVVGSPGAGILVTGINRNSADETFQLIKTPNGDIWVFSVPASALLMQHSDDDGATWETTATDLKTLQGIASVDALWFADSGTNFVCVMAGEDSTVMNAEQHFLFIDEDDASPTTPGNWTDESGSLPAFDASDESDNHVCVCKDSDENLWIAYKSGAGDIKVIKRTSSGTWSGSFEAWPTADNKTRPSLAIQKRSAGPGEQMIIAVSDEGAGTSVVYKTSPLESVGFSEEVLLFDDPSDTFNDHIAPQGDFISQSLSGYMANATNITEDTLWFSLIAIRPVDTVWVTGQQ